jgi:hypothetical protein
MAVGDSGIVLQVPSGWQVGQADSPGSIELTATSNQGPLSISVMVVGADVAPLLPFPGPTVIGTESLQLPDLGQVEVERIREKASFGLRYVRPWGNGAVEVRAEGDSSTCGPTFEALLHLVDFAR